METFLQFDQIIVPKVEHLSMLVRKKKTSLQIDGFPLSPWDNSLFLAKGQDLFYVVEQKVCHLKFESNLLGILNMGSNMKI